MTQDVQQITGGPSKMDFMLSLFDNIQPPRTVAFNFHHQSRVGFRASASVVISKVQREDGSGESFNFEGTLSYDNFRTGKKVSGYYHTQHRTGTFRFV